MKRCNGDNSFGPALGPGSDCHNFDFTILFEDCIFSLIPSILAIIAAIYRIYGVFKKTKVIIWPIGRALKLVRYIYFLQIQPLALIVRTGQLCVFGSISSCDCQPLESRVRHSNSAHGTCKRHCFRRYFNPCFLVRLGTHSGCATISHPSNLFLFYAAFGPGSCANPMAT